MSASPDVSRDELETALLRAQLETFEIKKKWGVVHEIVPALASLGVVVVGAVIAVLWISAFWSQKAEDTRAEMDRLELAKQSIEQELSQQRLAASDNRALGQGSGEDVDLTIRFHSCDAGVCSFSAISASPGAQVDAYGPCTGTFAFPESQPDFGSESCPKLREGRICSINETRTLCRFGPYLNTSSAGWWVTAESEGATVVRRITSFHP